MCRNIKKCTARKCDISKCHAECCTFVPLHQKFIEEHKDKIQRPIYGINTITESTDDVYGQCITYIEKITPEIEVELKASGKYIPTNIGESIYIDKLKQLCPFLTDEHKCAVYDERPEICRAFGSTLEPDNTFTCHYHLGKDYHFPKTDSEEYKQIDNFKYFIRDVYNNLKLFREMLPGVKRKDILKQLKFLGIVK